MDGSIEEGIVLTNLMAGKESFLKAMDASEILMDPISSFCKHLTKCLNTSDVFIFTVRINGHHYFSHSIHQIIEWFGFAGTIKTI